MEAPGNLKRKRNDSNDNENYDDQSLLLAGHACIFSIQQLFPIFRPPYVLKLAKAAGVITAALARNVTVEDESIAGLIEQLMVKNGDYPREVEPTQVQQQETIAVSTDHYTCPRFWSDPNRPKLSALEEQTTLEILKNTFPDLPAKIINRELGRAKFLYAAYLSLAAVTFIDLTASPLRRPRHEFNIPHSATKTRLLAELEWAERLDRTPVECGCCTDTIPSWQATRCSSHKEHTFCRDCIQNYVSSSLVGSGACQPVCFDISGQCTMSILISELRQCVDPRLIKTLEIIQQQEALRQAFPGAELEQCPKCEFQLFMEAPPEVDREFKCLNLACQAISCRLCNEPSHLPLSCEELSKKENALNTRRQIEEAMTGALLRKCNMCKNPFIKEYGCNKIYCSKCGNKQCYICGANVKDYQHFNAPYHGGTGECALWKGAGGLEGFHDGEVKSAADVAIQKLLAKNTNVKEDDLRVKFSERDQAAGGNVEAAAAAMAAQVRGEPG